MLSLKRLSSALALLTAALVAAESTRAQAPLTFVDAELAVPFGSVRGQIAFVSNHFVFVASDNPTGSMSIDRADITRLDRAGDVVTIVTRRAIRDADGERDTFRFRLTQSNTVMRWYETTASAATPAPPATTAAPASTPAPPAATGVIASYQVKHSHLVGSCQGTLILSETAVSYESLDRIEDARNWKLIDIKKVEQNGIYKLKVEPFQGTSFDFELSGKGIDSGEFRQLVDRIARARVGL
jgi:hypothetical protein